MAKAIPIMFAALSLLFVVALASGDDECRKAYEGDATTFQLCAPRIFPSFCHRRCISDNGAKGGRCGEDGCVCDFCQNPLECQKKYVGEETDFQLCAPLIYPPFCHRFCINQNGAKSGICTSEGCYCDFCDNHYPFIMPSSKAA